MCFSFLCSFVRKAKKNTLKYLHFMAIKKLYQKITSDTASTLQMITNLFTKHFSSLYERIYLHIRTSFVLFLYPQ